MKTPSEPAFTLAPAMVVRVASWPLDDLVALGDESLAQRAAQVELAQIDAIATLQADYEACVEAGRAKLWATTVADPRFRAALVLSSPGLHRQLGAGERPRQRNKKARHLDTSLFRYLSRACTRTEPFGLWTGVTLAEFGDGQDTPTRIEGAKARARFAPELEPWRTLLRELAKREPYRGRGPWCLNPTLRVSADGRWSYARRRSEDGALRWRALPESIGAGLRRALEGQNGSLDQLREHLRAEFGEAGDSLLELAMEQGLLVGGLSFPNRYADAWEALTQVEAKLEREQAVLWADVRGRARKLCEQLDVCVDAALAEPHHASDAAEAANLAEAVLEVDGVLGALVRELAVGLGIELPADARSWLRCDLGAGWMIALGREDRDRLEQILVDWSRLERTHHVGARRRARADARLRACPEHEVMAAPVSIDDIATQAANEPPISDAEVGPPLGALVLRTGEGGLRRPWLRGLSDVPTATHARHAYHLAERGDSLLPWFRAQYLEFAREGVEVVDLAYEHEGSPNLLSRPCYVQDVVAPWSGAADETLSAEALLCAGPQPGALLVHAGGRRMSLHAFTATATPAEDPILDRLLATSFDNRADQMRTLAEGPRVSEAPREPSMGTAILEPRRIELHAGEIGSLAAVRRFERYRRWQRLVTVHELPELVRVCIGARPGLVIPTSSPLALESAFEGLRSSDVVVVEEVPERGWLPGPHGAHVAELVVPVRRRDHLWCSSDREELDHAVG